MLFLTFVFFLKTKVMSSIETRWCVGGKTFIASRFCWIASRFKNHVLSGIIDCLKFNTGLEIFWFLSRTKQCWMKSTKSLFTNMRHIISVSQTHRVFSHVFRYSSSVLIELYIKNSVSLRLILNLDGWNKFVALKRPGYFGNLFVKSRIYPVNVFEKFKKSFKLVIENKVAVKS